MENTEISSDDLKEQRKKRRRIKARKNVSSSSEDLLLEQNKENRMTQNNQILPTFPQIEDFIPNKKSRINEVIENLGNRPSGTTASTSINMVNTSGKQQSYYILIMIMDTQHY